MQDFTGGGIHALPNKLRKTTGRPDLDQKIKELVAEAGCEVSCELIEQLVMTALKMAWDKITVADLKMFNRSLNEFRYAARVFADWSLAAHPFRIFLQYCMTFSVAPVFSSTYCRHTSHAS